MTLPTSWAGDVARDILTQLCDYALHLADFEPVLAALGQPVPTAGSRVLAPRQRGKKPGVGAAELPLGAHGRPLSACIEATARGDPCNQPVRRDKQSGERCPLGITGFVLHRGGLGISGWLGCWG